VHRCRPLTRRSGAAVAAASLALTLAPAAPAAADHTDLPGRVSLMGTLQSEIGCAEDWDEECTKADLAPVEGSPAVFEAVVELPKGTYEYKVRLNGSWDESYGRGADNAPLVLEAPAAVRVRYDHATHTVSVTSAAPAEGLTRADRALAGSSLREDLTRERFYFVMADRFQNGSPANDVGSRPLTSRSPP